MYLHHLHCGDLAREGLKSIINKSQIFNLFRMRRHYFSSEYQGEDFTKRSFGGCAARGYCREINGGTSLIKAIDPLAVENKDTGRDLHATFGSSPEIEYLRDYLCTWIGLPT
jgi:hypothetical protein